MPDLLVIIPVACGAAGLLLVVHGMGRARVEAIRMLDLYGGLLRETREIARGPTETKPVD